MTLRGLCHFPPTKLLWLYSTSGFCAGLNLHNTLAEMPLYFGAAMGPVVGCEPSDTCCQWCLAMTEALVVAVGAVVEAAIVEAHALVGEECL
jgi:hypothetical protein